MTISRRHTHENADAAGFQNSRKVYFEAHEDSILYKGKEFHHDQYLIFLMNKRISVKINGSIENENLAHNSSVKLSDTIVEKYFDDIEENSVEYLAIIELNKSINNLLTQKNIKKL